ESLTNRINLSDTPIEWEVMSRWFPAGVHRYELKIVGEVELAQFGFESGFPLEVEVFGQGAVSGVESEGRAGYGEELVLEAEAARGWVFDRWDGDVGSRSARVSMKSYVDTITAACFAKLIGIGDSEASSFGDETCTPVGDAGAISPAS